MNEREAFEAWFKEKSPVCGINAKLAARDAWLARAAVEADRAQRVPDDFLSHRSAWRAAMVIAEGFAANEDDASYWRHELKAFDNAYSMLASTPAPAQQDDTLERKISRAATHAMTDFEVTNSIIYKCPALRLPQSFIQQLGMTAQIVVLKGATPEIAEFIAAACNEATESAAQHQEPPQQERKPMTEWPSCKCPTAGPDYCPEHSP